MERMNDMDTIEAAYAGDIDAREASDAVERTIAALDAGTLRVAYTHNGSWTVNAWVKEAILLYYRLSAQTPTTAGPFDYHDKIPT